MDFSDRGRRGEEGVFFGGFDLNDVMKCGTERAPGCMMGKLRFRWLALRYSLGQSHAFSKLATYGVQEHRKTTPVAIN